MIRVVLFLLLLWGPGCAGAIGPIAPPSPGTQADEQAEPGIVEPATEPAREEETPLWIRTITVMRRGDAEHGLYRTPETIERLVLRSASTAPCASAQLGEEPRPGALWIDFFLDIDGRVSRVKTRGEPPLAWPCIRSSLGGLSLDPYGVEVKLSAALFHRPSSITWGRSPALRPMFLPRERGDAPREPYEISYDHDEADFLWSLQQFRSPPSRRQAPASGLARLLSQHRAAEAKDSPEDALIAATERLAEQDTTPATRATAKLLLARQYQLRGGIEASSRTLLSLVCPGALSRTGAPKEHSQSYWEQWEQLHPSRVSLHPTPRDIREWAKAHFQEPRKPRNSSLDTPSSLDEELTFRDPFAGCIPADGATPAMLAEAWAVLGDLHATVGGAFFGGAFSSNRAMRAYNRSLALVNDDVVRLQLALLHQRSWRHRTALMSLSELLLPREQASGEDALIRDMALPALVLVMLEPDLEDQPETEPFVPSERLFESLIDPADTLLTFKHGSTTPPDRPKDLPLGAIALSHVQDTSLVPVGAWFKQPLLMAMGQTLFGLNFFKDAEVLLESAVKMFPVHRDAPTATGVLIRLHHRQKLLSREGSNEQAEAARKLSDTEKQFSMSFLSKDSPWVQAHRASPEVLERAATIARQLAELPR